MPGGRNRPSRPAVEPAFWLLVLSIVGLAGCARNRAVATPVPLPPSAPATPEPPPVAAAPPAAGPIAPVPAYVEQGIASWYGAPFNGRRASDGEIYDMNLPVAAHRTLPFGSIVRVTNLNNGLHTDVRIIDRGPFVRGRIIDLSLAAARALDLVGPGTAPVRIELLSSPAPLGGDFAVQVGAFSIRENAERLRMQLLPRYSPIFIQDTDTPNGRFFRVRVGRMATQDAAQQLATALAERESLQTFVVRLDQTQCCTASDPAPAPAANPGGLLP